MAHSDQKTTEVRDARSRAARLCAALRSRGDSLSLDAAAEIEGALIAFVDLAADQSRLRKRAESAERNQRETLSLWQKVPGHIRYAVAHGIGSQVA